MAVALALTLHAQLAWFWAGLATGIALATVAGGLLLLIDLERKRKLAAKKPRNAFLMRMEPWI